VASKPGSLYLNNEMDVLTDTRNKIHEDPLFAIKQQEVKAKKDVISNPIKMKKLRQEVLMTKLKKQLTKEKKRHRDDSSDEGNQQVQSTQIKKEIKKEDGDERPAKRFRSRSQSPPRKYMEVKKEERNDDYERRRDDGSLFF